jgi:ubiquinone/menaquinone biosynthesis C-methylase UbiE/uncharacterized protein YbaR (Trm112 family)
LKEALIEDLICPVCSKKFVLKSRIKKNGEILEGSLSCSKNHKFPIKHGIPRLVFDKDRSFVKTEDAFSAKWRNYNKTYHSKKWFDSQSKWFLERFGWKTATNFKKFLKTRNRILDAGTGVGNSAKLFSANPNVEVFAIDASASIEFAYKKYGSLPNVHFLQADIRRLPFKKNFFDFICSDQVLHHTKNTESSFKILTKLLTKNGIISVYIYKIKGPMREFADNFIRQSTVKMTEKECIEFSKDMAVLGKNLSKIRKTITVPRDIPILQIKAGTYDVQRFLYWNFLKCWWSNNVPFEQSVATNFDWYFPKYAYRHSPNEVRKWFKDSKLKIIHFNDIESGISVNGKKL